MREELVAHGAGLDDAGPANGAGHAVAAFPIGVLLAAERCTAAIGPAKRLGAVVGRIHDDGVVLEAQFLELVEHLSHMSVVLDHAVGIRPQARDALAFRLQMGVDVHPGGVPPEEEGLVLLFGIVQEAKRFLGDFLVNGFHPFLAERAGASIFCVPSGLAQQ